MPRLVISKVWVLLHEDGTPERLLTPRQLEDATQLAEDQPDRYRIVQRDLMELVP